MPAPSKRICASTKRIGASTQRHDFVRSDDGSGLRDGTWLANRSVVTARRLLGNPGTRLIGMIADATRATVNGAIVSAIVKGAAVGVAYIVMGVARPLLFSAMTIVLAMVPLGAWVALAAASLTLFVQDGILLAPVGLFVFGAAVLVIGGNFILPALIGSSAELPILLVLIGILDGMQLFGLVGLFLGPVIIAALLTVGREWIGIRERRLGVIVTMSCCFSRRSSGGKSGPRGFRWRSKSGEERPRRASNAGVAIQIANRAASCIDEAQFSAWILISREADTYQGADDRSTQHCV